ncbi:MAG TPA: zinc transporter ZupT [Sedimentisphaerales bacterium]|nr:zinc transporter ZupT [Sedimentisphaerales bacterium]
MEVPSNIGTAVILTTLAGLSTTIGSVTACFIKKPKIVYLCFSLGLSAGVMIYISFVELLPQAAQRASEPAAVAGFFIGMAFMGLIDLLIPEQQNPHNYRGFEGVPAAGANSQLMKTGLLTTLAIGIHNLPEGLATFAAAVTDLKLGVFTAIAIAIHNIPEGIAVSVPILYATGNKRKALFYSFLSGITEPIGACIGFLLLLPFLSSWLIAVLMAFVAGIMVYISVDELLPMAHWYGHSHTVIAGIFAGMLIMALSLLML